MPLGKGWSPPDAGNSGGGGAGTLQEEGDGSIPRLVSQAKWEGDTVYEASLALCPWTVMTEFQNALREGQVQARPKWPPS